MEFDAFTGGVEPGGLRTKNQIRILICYLLSSVDAPLSRQDIIGIMQDNGLANYFEVTDALAELLGNGNITADEEHPDLLSATRQARMIAKQLDAAVPLSVRERFPQRSTYWPPQSASGKTRWKSTGRSAGTM